MAEDGEITRLKTSPYRPQETFQRAQEAQAEHEYPAAQAGIVRLPPGSRGPRSLYLKRDGDSFGFRLRHFIVYPPDSITNDYGRHPAGGALLAPMDTIFVRSVAEGSPAKKAGLHRGDRIISVNRIAVTNKSYSDVVQLIQRSPDYLHLLVVPKEEDILQQHAEAYNPVSNQVPRREYPEDRKQEIIRFLTQNPQIQRPPSVQVDAACWKSLQNPHGTNRRRYSNSYDHDNIYSVPQEIYVEPVIHDFIPRPRAQPQVPLYKKMGRRASEGSTISEKEYQDYLNSPEMVVGNSKMMSASKPAYAPDHQQPLPYPAVCRLANEGRRESASSLTSSLPDGSKDSLSSFDSTSTLTGQDDDSVIMSRFRKSFQQKEEFLRRSSTTTEPLAIQQREFYGRPKKLEKAMWPPNEPLQDLPSRGTKPIHQNFQRVKNDIDNERDLVQNGSPQQRTGGVANNQQQQIKGAHSPKDWFVPPNADKIQEGATAPASLDNIEKMNGSASGMDTENLEEQRTYPPTFQIVSKRAKQFESGKPLPEDDPITSDRTSYYRSELAKLSAKILQPNVQDRTRDFETLSSELRKDGSGTGVASGPATLNRAHRDSRSMDSSGSNASSSSINELVKKKLSGNVIISSGSKYIHCPPPADGKGPKDVTSLLDNQPVRMRDRSNSADSWVTAVQDRPTETKIKRQDAINKNEAMELSTELPPLIPVTVERMQVTPSVSVTPPSGIPPAVRPTQLDLGTPVRPARHLRLPTETDEVREDNNKPVVVRRTKNTNLADDERAMRRESYLKATEGGRVHFDSDLSDGDVSPHALRSAHRRWRPPLFPGDIQQLRKLFEDAASSLGGSVSGGSSSSVSLEREKNISTPALAEKSKVLKEGLLHCKITEIDGKRATDRSWKQIWTVLLGPKLFLYKDRHHQSPVDTSEAAEPSLAPGVDMRSSVVRVAEDYTKRKHVLRVSSVHPCRSEFLLQAENTVDLADWVKALQEQVAASTELEAKLETSNISKQQAVPQTTPATTTIQVQGSSRLSPQPVKSKSSASRNRSPTGQSPVSKTRKPSQVNEICTSPKSKTWRGRVAKQFRKIHQGANSPSSPTAPEGSTFGVPIDQCIPSLGNQFVPRFVEICTGIVDDRGLNIVGIYRVPGNNASVTALTEEVDRNYDDIPQDDPKWNDLHVVSSLLKSFFRKMPDSLVTNHLYPSFIEADKIEDSRVRMMELKKLISCLPPHNYHTLKHVIFHLKNVVDHSEINKMEAKNLAIVFGPTIVRVEEQNMQTMVNHMTHQCKIVESLLCYADWFFSDENLNSPLPFVPETVHEEPADSSTNQALLLDNICKYEALKDQKEKNGALFSSIISAAQRKVKRKSGKSASAQEYKEDATTPNGLKDFTYQSFTTADLKQCTTDGKSNVIPTTVSDIEKPAKTIEKVPWFNYSTDKEEFYRRVENFEAETKAMLTMPRKSEISVGPQSTSSLNSSSNSVNQQTSRLMLPKQHEPHLLTKTHSASNVFSRTSPNINANTRNSLDVIDGSYSVQYANRNANFSDTNRDFSAQRYVRDKNRNDSEFRKSESAGVRQGAMEQFLIRRGSSVENINSSVTDLNANGSLKKIKYENEMDILGQRTSSLDSLNKLQVNLDDGPDLLTTMTKLYDEKLKNENPNSYILSGENLPFVDDSPEKSIVKRPAGQESTHPELYRNPSLHKSSSKSTMPHKTQDTKFKESKSKTVEEEKDEDCTDENVPDNERHLVMNNKYSDLVNSNKLKRSESLNKPERTVSPLNVKLKRSESLNKTNDKLKRSDSLTKTEKTESNLSKRREQASKQRSKRKNGMPDRSIKRRHTVGGTKDPDKVNWLDNKYQEDIEASTKENTKEKTRTSSPDLSSTRRDRLLFEISLVGPENMVVALRQHLIGARPQSFPDAGVFKVPLESHV